MMCLGIDGSTLPKSRVSFAVLNLAIVKPAEPCAIEFALAVLVDPVSPVNAVPSAAEMITSSIALPIAIAAA